LRFGENMIDPKLANRVALVTGANHGIGAATAKVLADQGIKVCLAYYIPRTPYSKEELSAAGELGSGCMAFYHACQQQSADEVIQTIRSSGGIASSFECDLGETENIGKLFDYCEKELGPIQILIINHTHCISETFDPNSINNDKPGVFMTTAESIDRHFSVNARASALMMKEYLHRHIKRNAKWGRIVSLTTTPSHACNISYAASKNALVSYTLSAAEEMGKYGITANVVFPGATQTGYITPDAEKELAKRTPLGRVSRPEDVAGAILLLVSEQAHWITRQIINASGGFPG
jgi:3-oxoacyl-[acyl-carrier protein] reductase